MYFDKIETIPFYECRNLLRHGESGVLCFLDEEGKPDGIPVNYAFKEGHIHIHGPKQGKKLSALMKNPYGRFVVICDQKVDSEAFTNHFTSLIVEGRIFFPEDPFEKYMSMKYLYLKYSPDKECPSMEEIEKDQDSVIIKLYIEKVTGHRHL